MTASSPTLPGSRFYAGILGFAALATLAYWVIWFFVNREWLATASTREYYAFENAFPVADGWMSVACVLGAWALLRGRASALLWLLLAGSAALYLAGMDVLFDLENGIYRAPNGDWVGVAIEATINLATLVGGIAVIRFAWTNRARFLASEVRGV